MELVTTIHMGPDWSMTSDTRSPVPDGSAGVWVLDRAVYSWDVPEDEWPVQPEPATASWRIAATSPDSLPPLEVGTQVAMVVLGYVSDSVDPLTVAAFHGRISDADAEPGSVNTPTGRASTLEVNVTAVGLYVDLRETYVGSAPWPQENAGPRLERIFAAAGLTLEGPGIGGGGLNYSLTQFRELDVDHRTVAEVAEDHLAQVADAVSVPSSWVTGWQRGVVSAQLDTATWTYPDPDPIRPPSWWLQIIHERAHTDGGPLVLRNIGGQLVAVVEPITDGQPPESKSIPAELVDLSVRFHRDKGKATNRISVGGEFEDQADPSVTTTQVVVAHEDIVEARGPVTQRADSTVVWIHNAEDLGRMQLGDRSELVGRWGVEEVQLYLSEVDTVADALQVLGMFPTAEGGPAPSDLAGPYGYPVLVYGLQAAHQLTGQPFLAGTLIGATLTVERGRAVVSPRLRPGVSRQRYDAEAPTPRPARSPATAETIQRLHPTLTFADVDPSLTVYDLRLARNE